MSKNKPCTCSRNRPCREHKLATKAERRVEPAIHREERVAVGIAELRAKYGSRR